MIIPESTINIYLILRSLRSTVHTALKVVTLLKKHRHSYTLNFGVPVVPCVIWSDAGIKMIIGNKIKHQSLPEPRSVWLPILVSLKLICFQPEWIRRAWGFSTNDLWQQWADATLLRRLCVIRRLPPFPCNHFVYQCVYSSQRKKDDSDFPVLRTRFQITFCDAVCAATGLDLFTTKTTEDAF